MDGGMNEHLLKFLLRKRENVDVVEESEDDKELFKFLGIPEVYDFESEALAGFSIPTLGVNNLLSLY